MKRRTVEKTIEDLVADAYAALKEAEAIADKTNTPFEFSLGYGMGGTYYPHRTTELTRAEAIEKLASGEDLSLEELEGLRKVLANTDSDSDTYDWTESYSYEDRGWRSSSSSC